MAPVTIIRPTSIGALTRSTILIHTRTDVQLFTAPTPDSMPSAVRSMDLMGRPAAPHGTTLRLGCMAAHTPRKTPTVATPMLPAITPGPELPGLLQRATFQSGRKNQYSSWGNTVVNNGSNWAEAQHYSNANGSTGSFQTSKGSAGAGFSGANGNSGFVAKDANNNNVYAGADGNVYKKDSNGDWSKWDNGSWTPVDTT